MKLSLVLLLLEHEIDGFLGVLVDHDVKAWSTPRVNTCQRLKSLNKGRRVDSFSPTRRRFVWKSKPKQKVPQQNIQ